MEREKLLIIINSLCKALFIIIIAVGLISAIVDNIKLLLVCGAAAFATQVAYYSTKSKLDELED